MFQLKRDCTLSELDKIEAMIRKYGLYTIVHESNDGGIAREMGDDFSTSLFVKVFEIYLDKSARSMLDRNDVAKLLNMRTAYVQLRYDSRVKLGRIEVRQDKVRKIDRAINGFARVIYGMKPTLYIDRRQFCDIIDM